MVGVTKMKKIALIGGIALALIVLLAFAVPAFASSTRAASSQQATQQAFRPRPLLRLLLVQDEAKVDALIAQAKASGKITDDQAVKIKAFWTEHHKQFVKNVILTRLIWANDGAKVQTFLDKAVAAGKIKSDQAVRIMDFWKAVHAN
jgi:hypothetical protein